MSPASSLPLTLQPLTLQPLAALTPYPPRRSWPRTIRHIANSVATNPAIPHAAKVAFAQAIQALTGAPGTAAVSASSTAPVGVGHWHALAHLIRMSEPYQEAKDAAKNALSDFLKDLVSDRRGDWESVLGRIRQQSA